jgi:hypothetical protein
MFGSKPSPVPPLPTEDDAAVREAEAQARLQARRAVGRSATMLTGPLGVVGQAPVQLKTLLGE